MLLHRPMIAAQLPGAKLPDDGDLQCPNTASSGRKLIVTTRGTSYGFFSSDSFNRFISTSCRASVIPTASAPPGRNGRVVQDWKYMLRPYPRLHIDFLVRNPLCRGHHLVVLRATRAKFAFAV